MQLSESTSSLGRENLLNLTFVPALTIKMKKSIICSQLLIQPKEKNKDPLSTTVLK